MPHSAQARELFFEPAGFGKAGSHAGGEDARIHRASASLPGARQAV
jgi:hypothetical protein